MFPLHLAEVVNLFPVPPGHVLNPHYLAPFSRQDIASFLVWSLHFEPNGRVGSVSDPPRVWARTLCVTLLRWWWGKQCIMFDEEDILFPPCPLSPPSQAALFASTNSPEIIIIITKMGKSHLLRHLEKHPLYYQMYIHLIILSISAPFSKLHSLTIK